MDEILSDLKNKLNDDKSLRNRVFLESAISNLTAYHEETRKKLI